MNRLINDPTVGLSTLVELLRLRANLQSDERIYTFLTDGETKEIHLTYQELDHRARMIGAQLQAMGSSGERAILFYPPGLEFIAAFFGCLYAGALAVPANLPKVNRPTPRIEGIVVDSQATVLLTTKQMLSSNAKAWFDRVPGLQALRWVATDDLDADLADAWEEPVLQGDSLAFLQYTSGSTTTPRGVMVSHRNLLHNLSLMHQQTALTPQEVSVSWLPHYHDMGLIGGVLQPMYSGFPVVLMSPLAFLQRPARWLQAISRYQATVSGGPNFAYDLCVRKVRPEQLRALDLRNWEVAFVAAEPIRPHTLDQFAKAFSPCGFNRKAFYPGYGLAEATLFVSGGSRTSLPVIYQQASRLEQPHGGATANGYLDTWGLASCGQIPTSQKVVIAAPDTLVQCPDGQVGEIWISGPSVTRGYWNQPDETKRIFQAYLADTDEGPFLRTGDLGFFQESELYITGRLKDLIIIDGRNHYPQDIELTVEESHPAIQPGGCAAFSIDEDGRERLVITAEVKRRYSVSGNGHPPLENELVAETIRAAISEVHGLRVHDVVLLKVGAIPKTSSGKLQRYACRAGYLTKTLNVWK